MRRLKASFTAVKLSPLLPLRAELLSGLLSSAFEGYDLESMITAFLLARQGALEGPAVFPSYGSWFKVSRRASQTHTWFGLTSSLS